MHITAAGLANMYTLPMIWPCMHMQQFANIAAGIAVSKFGTVSISIDEILSSQDMQEVSSLISPYEIINSWRQSNQKIVFTNGCFDLLHPGHIHILHQAARLGDRLVVGINDDASVSRLKGSSRPVNTLDSRVCLLQALSSVDLVIPFSDDTPYELISSILPDVLVKGGDYSKEDIIGADLVLAHGGLVETIPFVDGYSSTTIYNSIAQSSS